MQAQAVIHIAITELFLSAELKENPHLRGCSLIIGTGAPGVKKGDVIAASPEAKALGVRPGLSLRKAIKAAPEAHICAVRYEASETLSQGFFAILARNFHEVESYGLDEAFMASTLRGSAPEAVREGFASAEKLARAMQEAIRAELGLRTTIGIGPNKFIARLAGLGAGKDGIVVVSRNEAAAFIKTFSLKNLPGVDRAVEKGLKDLGIGTVAEISETPLLFLKKNFGKSTGAVLYESSRAMGSEAIVPFHEAGGISREVTFHGGLTGVSIIRETLYMLAGGLSARLKAEARSASRLEMKVTSPGFACSLSTLELAGETDSFNTIWAGVLELLDRTSLPEKVILLGLKFSGLSKKDRQEGPPA
ncbi:MAG: hypothetical protein ACE5EZ_01050 [Thermodesulfobacteriota bacterium]